MALRSMTAPRARVMRDGHRRASSSRETSRVEPHTRGAVLRRCAGWSISGGCALGRAAASSAARGRAQLGCRRGPSRFSTHAVEHEAFQRTTNLGSSCPCSWWKSRDWRVFSRSGGCPDSPRLRFRRRHPLVPYGGALATKEVRRVSVTSHRMWGRREEGHYELHQAFHEHRVGAPFLASPRVILRASGGSRCTCGVAR